jgi:quinol monooxygenase YgiN
VAPPPDRRDQIVELFWSIIGPVRVEPGCACCGVYQDAPDGDTLLYMEQWETTEALERHMRSARYDRLLAVMEASARPPQLRYLQVARVQGMEYLEAVRLAKQPPAAADSGDG